MEAYILFAALHREKCSAENLARSTAISAVFTDLVCESWAILQLNIANTGETPVLRLRISTEQERRSERWNTGCWAGRGSMSRC